MIKQFILALTFGLFAVNAWAGACKGVQLTKVELIALKNKEFAIASDDERNQFAKNLIACLASTDPEVRDGIGYEAYFHWLRAGLLDKNTQLYLFNRLVTDIQKRNIDEAGVYLPFAVLVLSEVVRADRVTPYLSEAQRQTVVNVMNDFLISVRDYRGFSDTEGWRHSVAHSADVMLQLALNKAITKAQLDAMLDAIAQQVVPADDHFYIFGESKRLALPLLYILLRNQHSIKEWQTWFNQVIDVQPLNVWGDAYKSQSGLAKLHNTRQFLLEVNALLAQSKNEFLQSIKPDIEQALISIR